MNVKELIKFLEDNGCLFVRNGKGSHKRHYFQSHFMEKLTMILQRQSKNRPV